MTESLSSTLCKTITPQELARRIDAAVLKPTATLHDLERAVEEADRLNLRCLITTPTLLEEARGLTRRCVGAVVGFPLGYHTVEAKIKELEDVIAMGADEVDFVANTQLLLLGKLEEYVNEVKAATAVAKENKVKIKIIVEAPLLSRDTLRLAVEKIALEAEPDYIKTSTGYAPRPTIIDDVVAIDLVLRRIGLREKIGIKAAGGIRLGLQAAALIVAGADIIGSSTPTQLVESLNTACSDDTTVSRAQGR